LKKIFFACSISFLLHSTSVAQVPIEYTRPESVQSATAAIGEQPQPLNDINRNIIYPQEAQRAGIGGHVSLSGLINAQGKLEKIAIWESTDKMFEDAAINAIMNCKFNPAISKGMPIRSWFNFPIVFQLKEFNGYDTPPVLQTDLYSQLNVPKTIPYDSIPDYIYPVFGVATNGYVTVVEYLRPGNADIQQSVREALKKSTFQPAMKNGKPVDAWYAMTVELKKK